MPFSLKLQPVEIPHICRDLKIFEQNLKAFANTIDIAKIYGKRHKNILRKVREIIDLQPEFGRLNFEPTDYVTSQNKNLESYNVTKEGFSLLVLGFTGAKALEFRVKYVQAFAAMEKLIQQESYQPQIPDLNTKIIDANPRMTILNGNTPPKSVDKDGNRVYNVNDLKNSPFASDRWVYERCMHHVRNGITLVKPK